MRTRSCSRRPSSASSRVGFFLGGVLLALIVPFLQARGVSLREWMAWGVILTTIAACVGPDL